MKRMSRRGRIVRVSPARLPGRWKVGFALDRHTVSSVFIGHDEFGHEQFDTKRTELGELTYRLKYKRDDSALADIAATAADFVRRRRLDPEYIVPASPSRSRPRQPVIEIANALGECLSLSVVRAVKKTGSITELKSVHDFDKRIKLLENALAVTTNSNRVRGASVLLLDDLWRSGATLNAAASLLVERVGVREIIALTVTRTRRNQ